MRMVQPLCRMRDKGIYLGFRPIKAHKYRRARIMYATMTTQSFCSEGGVSYMNARITEITALMRKLESDLEAEFARRRLELAYSVQGGKVRFEEFVLKHHKQLRRHWLRHITGARPLMLVTAPFIYVMIVPFALLDVLVSIYQRVCFPVYGIPAVRRRDYMVFDRGSLAYLNWIKKVNCLYCSYANGVISYVRELAARTEQYWCPIKHAKRVLGAHDRYSKFADYGDAVSYQAELAALRKELNLLRESDS